jgi:hypothetical protein
VHTPTERTLITVAVEGTNAEVYPIVKLVLDIRLSNGIEKLSALEYKLNGPESAPAVVNFMSTDLGI